MDTTTHQNVQEIARIEREALRSRSAAERLGDVIASEAGRMWFIVLHMIWFAIWIGLNSSKESRFGGFDPFPESTVYRIPKWARSQMAEIKAPVALCHTQSLTMRVSH